MNDAFLCLHASCVALSGRGVLLMGPSGAGKSDLALQLIDRGATLVSDDQTELRAGGGGLVAAPPSPLAGLLEIRTVGLIRLPYITALPIALAVALVLPDTPFLPVSSPRRRGSRGAGTESASSSGPLDPRLRGDDAAKGEDTEKKVVERKTVESLERLPKAAYVSFLGHDVRLVRLPALAASNAGAVRAVLMGTLLDV